MDTKKTAVVTGGSSGMGLAIAQRLRADGMEVAVLDVQAPPDGTRFYPTDIRDTGQVRRALDEIGPIDVLVNNAGIYFEKYLEDTTDEELDRMVDINLKGSYRVTREALPKLKASRGSVVFIASCLGLVPELTSPLYCATKAGLVMLTKCLAQAVCQLRRAGELRAARPHRHPTSPAQLPGQRGRAPVRGPHPPAAHRPAGGGGRHGRLFGGQRGRLHHRRRVPGGRRRLLVQFIFQVNRAAPLQKTLSKNVGLCYSIVEKQPCRH